MEVYFQFFRISVYECYLISQACFPRVIQHESQKTGVVRWLLCILLLDDGISQSEPSSFFPSVILTQHIRQAKDTVVLLFSPLGAAPLPYHATWRPNQAWILRLCSLLLEVQRLETSFAFAVGSSTTKRIAELVQQILVVNFLNVLQKPRRSRLLQEAKATSHAPSPCTLVGGRWEASC